ncbi:DUF167 domain-containing protein [Planctomicrobium sp. SH664]|uniref:DUF167 domain-containing protein n=1 Tax=Planctomicrobium sp. SH664 TaxID=3448125 RepID=UPI003F5B7687
MNRPSPIELIETPTGVLLPVQGQPGSRRNQIQGIHDGRLKVAVTQVAEKGKANQEILKVLAKALDIAKSQLSVTSGQMGSRKMILITGLSRADVQRRLDQLDAS